MLQLTILLFNFRSKYAVASAIVAVFYYVRAYEGSNCKLVRNNPFSQGFVTFSALISPLQNKRIK